jgi:hypothetical protein
MSENESIPADSTPGGESVEQAVSENVATAPVAETNAQDAAATTNTESAATEPAVAEPEAPAVPPEEITYHAVEKDGQVTAIWEMQGRKHLRTIDPRSRQGQDILRLYTADHHDETPAAESSDAAVV